MDGEEIVMEMSTTRMDMSDSLQEIALLAYSAHEGPKAVVCVSVFMDEVNIH